MSKKHNQENGQGGMEGERHEIEDVEYPDDVLGETGDPMDDVGGGDETSGEGDAGEAEGPIDAESALRAELAELNEKYLRIAADYQNYVRRAEQNVVTTKEQQVMSMARELVMVLDHFDRAMEVDTKTVSADDFKNGVQIVKDELLRALGKYGVERIEAEVGEAFDPNRHAAMMRQASEEVESNHVVQQFQPGYMLGEKTIRPAGVIVAE
ncbi:nucleotide exchange factor GrpE [Poriferisphaera sp. WC338]|uniref:nucleotide exchange factor GrpE n=1 Tax=Poriferisphaera sp. WC338 TaxID=3425129 RepID=UPI003D81A6BA